MRDAVTACACIATADINLARLREQSVLPRYDEHVMPEDVGALQAGYRGKGPPMGAATVIDGRHSVDVRERPNKAPADSGP